MDQNSQDESHHRIGRTRRYIAWLGLLVLILVPFAIIDGPGASVLRELGLTDRDESFTELYFPDPSQLPRELSSGEPLAFDFSIRNKEGRPTAYRWQVRVGIGKGDSDDSSSTVIDSGELKLDDGESGGVHVSQVTVEKLGPATVGVVLVDRTEAIDFPVVVVANGADAFDD